jgi:hypothetical protein
MVDHCVQVYDPVLLLAVVNGSLWLKKKNIYGIYGQLDFRANYSKL